MIKLNFILFMTAYLTHLNIFFNNMPSLQSRSSRSVLLQQVPIRGAQLTMGSQTLKNLVSRGRIGVGNGRVQSVAM